MHLATATAIDTALGKATGELLATSSTLLPHLGTYPPDQPIVQLLAVFLSCPDSDSTEYLYQPSSKPK